MTVTFCGHKIEFYSDAIRKKLYEISEQLINQGADEFLFGGYGNFDLMAAQVIRELKEKYSRIRSVLVVPYVFNNFDRELYDHFEYPPIAHVPKRFAMAKRNKWMIDRSDVIVAYVSHDYDGSAKMLRYAKRKRKHVIDIEKGSRSG